MSKPQKERYLVTVNYTVADEAGDVVIVDAYELDGIFDKDAFSFVKELEKLGDKYQLRIKEPREK